MKVLLFICLLAFTPMVLSQCTGSIWSQLGATDAIRLATTTAVTDRAFGILLGDECLGYRFRNSPSNLHDQFVAFLATVFGGNINGTNNNVSGIVYRERGIGSNPIITSDNIAGLLTALSNIHQPLAFSVDEQNYFKSALGAVLNTFGVAACLVTQISDLLDATDDSIIQGGNFSKPCQTRSATINWSVPTNQTVQIAPGQSVCWNWADAAGHTVNETSTPAQGIDGAFGYGPANIITVNNASACSTKGGNPGPCYLGTSFSYCIQFPSTGAFTYNCGVHLNAMVARVNVVAATTTTTTTGSGGTTTTGNGGTTTGSSSAASTLRSSFIF